MLPMAHVPKPAAVKELRFRGSSLNDLLDFPKEARGDAGYRLDRVQNGLEPDDFKPMLSDPECRRIGSRMKRVSSA